MAPRQRVQGGRAAGAPRPPSASGITPAASRRKTPLSALGEFGVIEVIKRLLPQSDPRIAIGIGDDTAAVRLGGGKLLLATCDIQLEGHHFRRDRTTAYQLGRRAAAINISDIAAMGGTPLYALVSLGLPMELDIGWVEQLYHGLKEELGQFRATIVGGNITASEKVLIDITLWGEVEEAEALRRSGAHPGDAILVTGSLGASRAGLLALEHGLADGVVSQAVAAHLTPTPRVREGRAIAASRLATAMIDISDGLASDLRHICQASGLAARVWSDALPVAPGAREVARRLGLDPLDLAVGGGEDYELLVTAPQGKAQQVADTVRRATGTAITVIGEMLPGPFRMWLRTAEGQDRPLMPEGWDHFKRPIRQGTP